MCYMDNVKSGELHVSMLQELKLFTKNTIKLIGTHCNGLLTFAFFVKPYSHVQGFPREVSSHKLMHCTICSKTQKTSAKYCKSLRLE